MKTFLVWEDECAEDGSFEIEAVDEDDAIRILTIARAQSAPGEKGAE